MVSQPNWRDRNLLKRTRLYVLILLFVIGALILFLQQNNVMRLLNYLVQ